MRPIFPQTLIGLSDTLRRGYGAGGYRALLIGLVILGLSLIGLYYGVISFTKICNKIGGQDPAGQDSEISQNYYNYYPGEARGGLLGMLRTARRPPQSSGRDVE